MRERLRAFPILMSAAKLGRYLIAAAIALRWL
ncbi:hypothetical protein SAMN05421681_104215 [Lysobacter enzymogenes]|nr:hypothetical protein SAMN05421681_104215 [Lysobacter enzymogenes]